MRKSPLATAPRWPSSMPYRVKERMRGSLQPEEKNQATDEEADAYQPIDELSPVDKLCDRVLDCYLWWFSLILAWRAACFGYPMNSSLPSMNIAGVIGTLYLTASSGSSVTSITLQARSGTSPFIPSRTETTFCLISRGVQHDAIRTSTFNPGHHWVASGMFAFLDLPPLSLSSDAPEPTGT